MGPYKRLLNLGFRLSRRKRKLFSFTLLLPLPKPPPTSLPPLEVSAKGAGSPIPVRLLSGVTPLKVDEQSFLRCDSGGTVGERFST